MNSLTNANVLASQYGTSDKLNTRISIHDKYSTNKQGFGNWISEHYRIPEGASVLELGCGTGDMWKGKHALISRCSRLVLSDFSEGMVNKTKETLAAESGIEYLTVDIQSIPFPDHTFDVVIANMMLYHVPDLAKGLSEVRRVLKEGGTFYCATYGENGMMEYIGSLFTDYGVGTSINTNFTLQNGKEALSPFFTDVERDLYEDSLAVTEVEDLVDYVFSLSGMTDLRSLPRDTVRSVLASHMKDGVLTVPKEYGMFVCRSPKA